MNRSLKRAYRTRGGRNSLPQKLAWIRTLGCLVCGRGPCEAHHVRVRGSRADDAVTLPLCDAHHRNGPSAYHVLGRRGFESFYGLNVTDEAAKLHARWKETVA